MGINFTPANIVPGEFPTATKLDSLMHDPWEGLQEEWDAYVPVWTSTGSNPTLGNGTLTGAFRQVGKTVDFRIVLTIGSTTNVAGATAFRFSLPVPSLLATTFFPVGAGVFRDESASDRYVLTAGLVASATILLCDVSGAQVSESAPVAPANTDLYLISGRYEAA